MKQTIKNRFGGRTLYECEADSLAEALRQAVNDGASLDGASLEGALLNRALLNGASLNGVSLEGAWLNRAWLNRALLNGASLEGARLNWQSHDLIAEILRRAAGNVVAKRSLAGLVLISRDWCWDEFLAIDHSEREWALDELRKWVQSGDGAPDVLRTKEPNR